MKGNLFILLFLGISVSVLPFFVFAESYDIYVDSSYSGDDPDGSQEKPFKKLSDAAEKASGSQKIYLKNGEYERATLGKSVKLFGQSKKAVVRGTLTLSGGNELKNITVSGGSPAVLISKNADVTIEDCDIEGFGGIGIQASPGNGEVIVKNSGIRGGAGKGFYIQEGRKIEIINNKIHNNKEEGIDVRARVSGSISGNTIYNNGESGIEFVTGSSKINITKNSIKNNGASAIASQFYEQTSKTGKIVIIQNALSKNRKYGFDCAIPSGGEPSSEYWGDSIELTGNTVEGNKMKPISGFCNMMQVTDEEKEKENNKISEVAEGGDRDEEKNQTEVIEEEMIIEEEKVVELDKGPEEKLNNLTNTVLSQNKIKAFFIGPDYENIKMAKVELEKVKNARAELFKLLGEVKSAENKNIIKGKIAEISDIINSNSAIISEQENKFSLFRLLSKMLLTREDIVAMF